MGLYASVQSHRYLSEQRSSCSGVFSKGMGRDGRQLAWCGFALNERTNIDSETKITVFAELVCLCRPQSNLIF
jgi:hypothetical protein